MKILERPVDDTSRTTDVNEILRRRPDSFQWAISETSVEDNGIEIAKTLIQATVIADCDGSFKDRQGT